MIDDTQLHLSAIWGTSEGAYSGLIAQGLAFSPTFRKAFLVYLSGRLPSYIHDELFLDADDVDLVCKTEHVFDQASRIDILIQLGRKLFIGIENKKWAVLQQSQLGRYAHCLRNMGECYLLVLLTPSRYVLPITERPSDERFVHVTYQELIACVQGCLSSIPPGSFEHRYLSEVKTVLGSQEGSPLSAEEIKSLKYQALVKSAIGKLGDILTDYPRIERSEGNFMLVQPAAIDGMPVYSGFRYGVDWYYSEPLLSGEPEAIVYVKDVERDRQIADARNDRLRHLASSLEGTLALSTSCITFYPRKGINECRLAVRKGLSTFTTDSEIRRWLDETTQLLSTGLGATIASVPSGTASLL